MKGDFSRGHRPDQKRDKLFRRVLLQEGRLVTDSDVAAGVDAFDTLVRHVAADLGCETGSPDLGYLITPGPLFALFETLDGVSELFPSGVFKTYRDYGKKYKERFPSIYINATASAGHVTVKGRRTLKLADFGKLHVWAILPAGVKLEVKVNGAVFTTTAGSGSGLFENYVVDLTGMPGTAYDTVQVGFSAAGVLHEVWVAMIEGVESAGTEPTFWATGGRYYAKGLDVTLTPDGSDGAYSEVTFPPDAGFTAPNAGLVNDRQIVAYLEAWERLITRVEDKGILEQALGGLDTTVRSRALGQVKIARFDPAIAPDGDKVVAAFVNVDRGAAELEVTTSPKVDDPDPCVMPEEGGYTGPDNRFYRFEVHLGGDIGTAILKWSKNNGADLYDAVLESGPSGEISLRGTNDITDGDLVELTNESHDLGDSADASVRTAGPTFRPAERRVGTLYYVKTGTTSGVVVLLDLVTKNPVVLDATLFDPGGSEPKKIAKIRRWHGLLDTRPVGSPVSVFPLGDGIEVKLGGTGFRAGDYWQYEARRLKDNANGPWKKSPHGPERIFVPLALLTYKGSGQPLLLERWYDHQFSAICELNADDIAYDGGKVGTEADTVQEAIDELYSKVDEGGCCDVHVEPSKASTDDAARIQDAIDNELPAQGGTICLKRGVYTFLTTVTVNGKRVRILGCPAATCVRDGAANGPMFEVLQGAALALEDLILWAPSGGAPLVSLEGAEKSHTASELVVKATAIVGLDPEVIAIRGGGAVPNPPDAALSDPWKDFKGGKICTIRVEDAIVVGNWPIALLEMWDSLISGSFLLGSGGCLYAGSATLCSLQRNRMVGSLSANVRKALGAADPANLEPVLTALFEKIVFDEKVLSGSVGVAVGAWQTGEVVSCIVAVGACSGRFGRLEEAQFNDNLWIADEGTALRIDEVRQGRWSGEKLNAKVVGLHVPWRAQESDVLHCRISAHKGIVLGASVDGTPIVGEEQPTFSTVRIADCLIEAKTSEQQVTFTGGILCGPYPTDQDGDGSPEPVFFTIRDIEITGNFIQDHDVGLLSSALDPDNKPDRTLRIASNQITGSKHTGIHVAGAGATVSGNLVEGRPTVIGWGGILLVDASSTVVRNNRVYMGSDNVLCYGISTSSIAFGSITDLLIEGNVLTNADHDVGFFPLLLQANPDTAFKKLTIVGNQCTGFGSVILWAYDFVVQGNRFEFGGSEIGGGNALTIMESRHGHISDNWFGGGREGYSLHIVEAFGDWQIENNRADGRILLQPLRFFVNFDRRFEFSKFFEPGGIQLEKMSASIEEMLSWSFAVATDEEKSIVDAMKEKVWQPSAKASDEGAGAKKAANKDGTARIIGPAARLGMLFGSRKGETAETAETAGKDIATYEISVAVKEIFEGISYAAALDVWQEGNYQALVLGNWAGTDLVVGFPLEPLTTGVDTYPAAVQDRNSVVQITANRANQWMVTNNYDHLVATGNAAADNEGILAGIGPSNVHNHDF
jgi:hypothetical protein